MGTTHANSFGWVGRVLALAQVPLMSFTATLLVRAATGAHWSWWLVFVPVFVLLAWLLLATSTPRVPSPSLLRYSWVTTLLCYTVFVVLLVVRLQYEPYFMRGETWPLFLPHWICAGAYVVFGIASFVKYSFYARSGGRAPRRRKNKHFAVGFCLCVLGITYTLVSSLAYAKVSGANKSIAWFGVLAPWFAADAFAFFVGAVMFLFSLGASESAMFPLYQQVVYMLACATSIGLKVALALELDYGTPPVVTACCTIGIEVLLAVCGTGLACGRNRDTPLFEHHSPKRRDRNAQRAAAEAPAPAGLGVQSGTSVDIRGSAASEAAASSPGSSSESQPLVPTGLAPIHQV
eukprot:m51a1_g11325 hypothetical protein (348) ;mRNA; r:125754-127088